MSWHLINTFHAKKTFLVSFFSFFSQILCVQNGGLGNSVSREDILEIFSQYGCVQDIIMIPRKPYCFVCFDNCDSSLNAKKKTTGYLLREGIDPSQNVVLYPFFVSQGE